MVKERCWNACWNPLLEPLCALEPLLEPTGFGHFWEFGIAFGPSQPRLALNLGHL